MTQPFAPSDRPQVVGDPIWSSWGHRTDGPPHGCSLRGPAWIIADEAVILAWQVYDTTVYEDGPR